MLRHCLATNMGRILCITSIFALGGCGQRPPDCTSPQTVSVVQQVVKQEIQRTTLLVATRGVPQDLRPYWEGVVSRYVDGLKVEVSEIVSNGYDANAKKHSCEGKISLTTLTSDSAQLRSTFTSQATAKGNGEFLVGVDQAGTFARAVVDDFVGFAREEAARQEAARDTAAREAAARTEAMRQAQESAMAASSSQSQVPSAVTPASPNPSSLEAAAPVPQPESPQVAATQATPPVPAPSFNCAAASTPAERMICTHKELAEADARMAAAYRQVLASAADKEGLRTAQAGWRKGERDVCPDPTCMLAAYQRRLAQLGSPQNPQ